MSTGNAEVQYKGARLHAHVKEMNHITAAPLKFGRGWMDAVT